MTARAPSEAQLMLRLRELYALPQWALIDHVRSATGVPDVLRIADVIAVDTWSPGDTFVLHGGEVKRMLEFIVDVAKQVGLSDYRVSTNVGRGAGQTIFHLHWHLMGDTSSHLEPIMLSSTAVTEL